MKSFLIHIYQAFGIFKHRLLYTAFGFTSRCKHTPSCSRYAEEQLNKRGTIVGSYKAIMRIITCW